MTELGKIIEGAEATVSLGISMASAQHRQDEV